MRKFILAGFTILWSWYAAFALPSWLPDAPDFARLANVVAAFVITIYAAVAVGTEIMMNMGLLKQDGTFLQALVRAREKKAAPTETVTLSEMTRRWIEETPQGREFVYGEAPESPKDVQTSDPDMLNRPPVEATIVKAGDVQIEFTPDAHPSGKQQRMVGPLTSEMSAFLLNGGQLLGYLVDQVYTSPTEVQEKALAVAQVEAGASVFQMRRRGRPHYVVVPFKHGLIYCRVHNAGIHNEGELVEIGRIAAASP